jgi:outer membrane receptor protein involved in Fe transport
MTKGKMKMLLLSLSLMLTVLSASVRAQAVYGSISGTITDPSGAVVPGAVVTITSVERKTSDTVTTNDSGLYVKERLLPGTYELKVEAQGFKQSVVPTVIVNVDRQTPVDIALETGAVSDTITVTAAEGQLLKTDRADVATTFESKQITDLPILDRNFTKFILLTPGTQQLQWQHAASENPQGSTQIMVNGQHFSGTGYQLDGTENRDPILGIIVINPNFEAIGETKITSQNYDAEFGQAIAGVVSVQTKSGTNEFHGSIFEFRQNDVLQARNPFTQSQPDALTGKFIPDTLRNQFGGAIGGPIRKEKLFFFGDYQGTRSKVGGSRLLTVPTLRARMGDFGEYPVTIFDPATTVVDANGNLVSREAFAGNRIPQNRLSPQALRILELIPLPSRAGIRDNFVASGSELFDNDTFDVRIDNRVSDKMNLFGRYSFADFTRDGPTAFGAGGGQELVSLGGTSAVRNHSIAIGFDRTLSDSMVWDFRFGFFKYKVAVLPFDFGASTAADVGVPGLNLDDTFTSGLFAGFVGGDAEGLSNFGSGLGVNRCNCPLDQDEKQFQWVTNLLKTSGNHTFKFGVDVRRAYNLRVPSDIHRSGELTFAKDRTRGPEGGGLGLATFLLGDVTSFGRFASPNTDARERQWRHFYYGQDTWRATQKLTINYGLRLDVINPQTINEPGNAGFLDLDTGEIKVAGIGDIGLDGDIENSLNWAPRLGIAYQISDKTVIRAGIGRSYDIGVFGSLFGHSVTQNLPVLAAQRLNAPANFERVFTLAQGPPAPIFPAIPANGRFLLPDGIFSRALPDKQRLPSVDAYNVTIQHQLTNTISVEAGYVGNKGTHVFAGDGPAIDINQATLVGFGTIPRNERRPLFNKFGWTQPIDFFCNCADNRYDSLQLKLTKRFSSSYSILTHYTLQRAIQDSAEQFFFDRELNRGPADWERKHNFVLSQVAELPFGRGRRFLADVSTPVDWIVGGWQFNSNTTIQSGLPFNVCYDAGANIDTGPCRPDIVGDPRIGEGGQERWFDPTAFANPGMGRFGNLPRNSLRGPGYWRTDASLFKKFRFTESKELEFRVESVNVFNHVNLGNPIDFIGNPASPNANAGQINSTAYGNSDPQRNFQFALKFKF